MASAPATNGTAADGTATGAHGPGPHQPPGAVDELRFEDRPLMGGRVGVAFALIFFGLILLAGPAIVWIFTRALPHAWLFGGMVLGGLLLLVLPFLVSFSLRYRVTNYRIDRERGLFSKTVDTVEMWHVEHLAFRQSFLQRLFGVGTIIVVANDPTIGKLALLSVHDARDLFKRLEHIVIAVKRGSGVMKIDPGI